MRFTQMAKVILEGAYIPTELENDPEKKKVEENLKYLKLNVPKVPELTGDHTKDNVQLYKYHEEEDAYYKKAVETRNLIMAFPLGTSFLFNKKKIDKTQLFKLLLKYTKSPKHDFEKLTQLTIDGWRKAGYNLAFYQLYKNIIDQIADSKEESHEMRAPRDRRETSPDVEGTAIIYYFGQDDLAYAKKIFLPEPNTIQGKYFWSTDQFMGRRVGGNMKPKPFNKFDVKIKEAMPLDEFKNLIHHDEAKAAWKKRCQEDPKLDAWFQNYRKKTTDL